MEQVDSGSVLYVMLVVLLELLFRMDFQFFRFWDEVLIEVMIRMGSLELRF